MNNPQPEPQEKSPQGGVTPRFPQTKSLVQLFAEAFFLLGRYFIIVYPVFLYFIISSLLFPRTMPNFTQPAWWVVTLGLIAIRFIFMAGWNTMMFKAVEEWQRLKQINTTDEAQLAEIQRIPFRLLKAFIPGMGEFGVSFIGGSIISFILTALPVAGLLLLGFKTIGIPQFLLSATNNLPRTQQGIDTLLQTLTKLDVTKLSAVEQTQLFNWDMIFLGILVFLFVFNGLTLFWQQFLIIKQCNPFKAFIHSFKHAIGHPFATLIILLYVTMFSTIFSLMSALTNFLGFFGNFLLILALVYFGLFMYLYLAQFNEPEKATEA